MRFNVVAAGCGSAASRRHTREVALLTALLAAETGHDVTLESVVPGLSALLPGCEPPPLRPKYVWSMRTRLQTDGRATWQCSIWQSTPMPS
jgi:hypothetical protein